MMNALTLRTERRRRFLRERPGLAPGLSAASAIAAIPNGRYVEYFRDGLVLNVLRPIARQRRIGTGGSLLLPRSPGLGFDFDTTAVERWTIEGWK